MDQSTSTGLPGLDKVLQGLWPGDNVVWMVEHDDDYAPVTTPLCAHAEQVGAPLVYFHFARHAPLLSPEGYATVHSIDASEGFEHFVTRILDIIEQTGCGAYYVFDCLSDLAADWFSDRMLGNFFMIVCPYLYRFDTIAYFALIKHRHSIHATEPIAKTAQVILEVFRSGDRLFIQPLRVWERHSPTMYMLHSWDGDVFAPVSSSSTIAEVLRAAPKPWLEFTYRRVGVWGHIFQEAQEMVEALERGAPVDTAAKDELFRRLIRMMLTRDARFEPLAARYFELPDLVEIMGRMIGTGMIGGKSLGMLLARAILEKTGQEWSQLLESHDSFYIGSDVFYTYLVQNDCWWLRRLDTDFEHYLQRAALVRERIRAGVFPAYIEDQFREMLDYFGQSPLIVRSSSLLEDSYGNSFSGKYESVFLANKGTPEERLQAFLTAVKTVYASTMSETSLTYRQYREVLERDEQMALLVQRVSGEMYDGLFFPQAAGVGFSFNPYVWREDIDPKAGVLRLVFGLGTRAVNRTDDDHTRLVALNAPLLRPEEGAVEAEPAQQLADVLDLEANALVSRDAPMVAAHVPAKIRSLFVEPAGTRRGGWDAAGRRADAGEQDRAAGRDGTAGQGRGPGRAGEAAPLTFERLLSETRFVPVMRELCRRLEQAYEYPVDIEFTVNFSSEHEFRLNLLQCRPFQVKIEGEARRVSPPEQLPEERIILESRGPIIGQSRDAVIDTLIYIRPSAYSELSMADRYSIARLIGRVVHTQSSVQPAGRIMLVGPGRWGTTMPSLGLPVSFNEISKASVICELALMHDGLVPDVSLGTHFFNDLVELNMLYLAVSPGRAGHRLKETLILSRPNRLTQLIPEAARWSGVLHVIQAGQWGEPGSLVLNVDSLRQHAVLHWRDAGEAESSPL